MRIFVSGPYGDHNPDHVIEAHVAQADEAAKQLVLAGHVPFCPHKMMHGWERDKRLWPYNLLLLDETFLQHWAQAVLRLPGESKGADWEVAQAKKLGLPVYYRLEDVGRPRGNSDGN